MTRSTPHPGSSDSPCPVRPLEAPVDPDRISPLASRRRFLAGAGLTIGAAGAVGVLGGSLGGALGPGSMTASVAAAQGQRHGSGQLVVVFLRGGTDGLSVVVPAGDPGYYSNRPGIAVPAEATLALDGMFGFHPAMAPLYGLWQDRRLAVVQAVGNTARSRSHFDAQDLLEQGSVTRRGDGAGWLTRHLATTASNAPHGGLFRGVAISSNMPGSLRGSSALSIPSLASFGLGGTSGAATGWNRTLRMAYSGFTPAEATGQATLAAITATTGITPPPPGAGAFADAAALLGSNLGVEVVTIDVGGWDTHNAMGTHSQGDMRNLVAGLATNLANLQADLDARGLSGVTTVVMSEFGRRVLENASGGTDHGAANVMLVMGAQVAGGVVHGTWPGLAPAQLDRGDVAITTDVRDVLWEIVRDVLGNPSPQSVFDGHTPTPVDVTA